MAEQPRIVTGIGKAELHRILVRGYDLKTKEDGSVRELLRPETEDLFR